MNRPAKLGNDLLRRQDYSERAARGSLKETLVLENNRFAIEFGNRHAAPEQKGPRVRTGRDSLGQARVGHGDRSGRDGTFRCQKWRTDITPVEPISSHKHFPFPEGQWHWICSHKRRLRDTVTHIGNYNCADRQVEHHIGETPDIAACAGCDQRAAPAFSRRRDNQIPPPSMTRSHGSTMNSASP